MAVPNIGLTERFDRRDIREDHKAVKTPVPGGRSSAARRPHADHGSVFHPAFLRLLGRIRFILPIAGIGLLRLDGAFSLDIFPTF